ncbi:hypothetical protein Tco_0205722 [Tanacetum coccineum]
MLESEAFKTYRAYGTGEKAPKSKATKKKTDSESSPKTKPSQASKGKRIKNSAKGDKPSTTKLKGLTVLSEVALSEAEQMNQRFLMSNNKIDLVQMKELVTNQRFLMYPNTDQRVKKNPGNDDNDNEDDDEENDSQRTKSDDEGDDFVHPNLSTYKLDDEEEEKEEEKAEDDDEVISDQKVSTPPDYELTEEDENQEDDDTMGEDKEDEENGNLQQQSFSVSSDLVAKFINPSPDTGIDSILNPNAAVSITPSSATIIPQIPIPIIQPQQQTHDSTTNITTPTTTTMPEIPNFASLFGFERKRYVRCGCSVEIRQAKRRSSGRESRLLTHLTPMCVKNIKEASSKLKPPKYEQVNKLSYRNSGSLKFWLEQPINLRRLTSSLFGTQNLELKKILMDKMEENNSIDRSDVQKNLYRVLLEA